MKAFLMHRDKDFDLERELPAHEEMLTQDLELNTLFAAMADGDRFLFDMSRRAVLLSLTDPAEIEYRQHILADCLEQPVIVRDIYQTAVAAIEGERRSYFGIFRTSPDSVLYRSLQLMPIFVELLKRLRQTADQHAGNFRSAGLTRFCRMLSMELSDDYLHTVESHLKELAFRRGMLISAELGKGNKGASYILRQPREQSWRERIYPGNRSGYSFQIPDRDEGGFRALSELRDKGTNLVANAIAQSADHILGFFRMLRSELAFYVGCLNLHERLTRKGEPTCFPTSLDAGKPMLTAQGLFDACLTLRLDGRVVGNDLRADGKRLMLITGANQGGKSTFLRSLGLAQLMMQCGMFVPAEAFRGSVCDGVFTHYRREEDVTMESGKLDEEMGRMSDIAGEIRPNCVLLCNESFASTNEREGSEIAWQIVRALTEAEVRVFFVTHLFDLVRRFYFEKLETALFLRAERLSDGRRTFRLCEGEPLPTSYGADLYQRIFGTAVDTVTAPRI